MPGVMTQALTFAPAIGPTASVTAPDTTYGPTGNVGLPTTPGVAVGPFGKDARPLPHPASSSRDGKPECELWRNRLGRLGHAALLDGSERPRRAFANRMIERDRRIV